MKATRQNDDAVALREALTDLTLDDWTHRPELVDQVDAIPASRPDEPPALRTVGVLLELPEPGEVHGAWTPYWRYEAICLEPALAQELAERFRLDLIDVRWHASSPGDARQIVAPTVGPAWFDPRELHRRTIAQHGKAGAECTQCGVWRWLPLGFAPPLPSSRETLPPLLDVPEFEDFDLVASPEWFGDGCNSFRQALVRRSLAEAIVSASPRDFRIVEPSWA